MNKPRASDLQQAASDCGCPPDRCMGEDMADCFGHGPVVCARREAKQAKDESNE
jgi:hypothetical protein